MSVATPDGPLSGVPFAVKDNIDTVLFPTTAGTESLRGSRPIQDARVVAALRAAGGAIIGKTNMHELALGITSNNAAFGPVRNPRDTRRSAGGSSGGSAAAVALGIVPFALGTDTGGSVRIPAAHCGIVGFRPSTGRYPSAGVVPLSHTRDTVGILASCVEDVACVDAILVDGTPRQVKPFAMSGAVFGVPRVGYFADLDPRVEEAVDGALEHLTRAGAELVDIDLTELLILDARCGFPIVFYETIRDLARYLAGLPAPYSSLTVAQVAERAKSPDVAAAMMHMTAQPVTDAAYAGAMRDRERMQALHRAELTRRMVDAIVYPTVPMLPPPLGDDEATRVAGRSVPVFTTGIRNVSPASMVSAPALSLPCTGDTSGLPVGLSIETLPGTDDQLLAIAAGIEAAIRGT
ncbi:MAG: amidase family protein [Rhodanobacteraceae bacterium]